jgi:hypothetical protein
MVWIGTDVITVAVMAVCMLMERLAVDVGVPMSTHHR